MQTTLGPTVTGNVKDFPMLSDLRQEPRFSPKFGLMKSRVKSQPASGVQSTITETYWKLQLVLHPLTSAAFPASLRRTWLHVFYTERFCFSSALLELAWLFVCVCVCVVVCFVFTEKSLRDYSIQSSRRSRGTHWHAYSDLEVCSWQGWFPGLLLIGSIISPQLSILWAPFLKFIR